MVDIVRAQLLDGVKRFPLFTVQEQLSFILTSADMEGKTPTEHQTIIDEILDILYPGLSKTEQEFAFVRCYCASFGKNAVKVSIQSRKGRGEAFMVIHDYQLVNEYKVDDGVTVGFKFPRTRTLREGMFIECIDYVVTKEGRFDWIELHEDTKNDILDLITMDDMENIVLMLTKSCHVTVRDNVIHTLVPLFKVLFNKSELNEFFKTNYLLNKNGLNVGNMMTCSPMERQIYVALLAEDLKKEHKK